MTLPSINVGDPHVEAHNDERSALNDIQSELQGRLSESALSAAIADAAPASEGSLAPFYVSTIEFAGSGSAAPGVRTGLPNTTHSVTAGDGTTQYQGYTTEHTATGVTGTADAYTLAVADTTTLTTLDGDGTKFWDCVIINGDGRAITNTVLDVVGGTVTLLRKLPFDIAAGSLSSRVDSVAGQHLTAAGTKALAQHIANFSPLIATRGRILEGMWDTLPQQHHRLWSLNAALTAYGVSNSAAPVVQSNLFLQAPLNVYDTKYLYRRAAGYGGGAGVGTHLAGHGATTTLRTARRSTVIEFTTNTNRSDVIPAARIRVVATSSDGAVLYDNTVHGGLAFHRIPVVGIDSVTLDVTNTDGAIYYLELSQLTVREAGQGGPLRPKHLLLIGDSWTQYYDHLLGDELAIALGCKVTTFGKGGTTSEWDIAWYEKALEAAGDPDMVMILDGTNDLNNNQDSTMTLPDGSTVPMWPNGLTAVQAQELYIRNIKKLISMTQQRGLRPVVIAPGSVNPSRQFDAANHLEQPGLMDWSATTEELDDISAYVNVVGKNTGTAVTIGAVTKRASGPDPSDKWIDPVGDSLYSLLRTSLNLSPYLANTGITIGTDSNADGLSDGLTYQDSGTQTGDTYTPSIVGGNQRFVSNWAASGADGQRRLKMTASVTEGHEYLALWDVLNATASQDLNNSFSDLTGVATVINASNGNITIDAAGKGSIWYRATANATGSKYSSISRLRSNGNSHTMDIRHAVFVDLTTLFADHPVLAGNTTSELVSLILGRL